MGRLPVVVSLHELTEEVLVRILSEPKNALAKQYHKLFELDGVELEFNEDALASIAKLAIVRKTGARGLRSIIEKVMMDIMYDIPSRSDVKKCVITKETIENNQQPTLLLDNNNENAS